MALRWGRIRVASQSVSVESDLQHEVAEAKKPSRQILAEELAEGVEALERSAAGLFVSGLSAGLDIGFSVFLMAVTRTLLAGRISEEAMVFLAGNMYAVGFIFVVLGRSELFTEQTTLAVLPVLRRRASVAALARLWGLVLSANLLGAAAFAGLVVIIGPALGVIDPTAFGVIARHAVNSDGPVIFASGLFAGWLMGLVSWLVAASRDTISQIVLVWLITTVIGIGRLHHVVVGSVEVLAGLFAGQGISLGDVVGFIVWAALGNALGGSIFVALIKYNVAVRGQDKA